MIIKFVMKLLPTCLPSGRTVAAPGRGWPNIRCVNRKLDNHAMRLVLPLCGVFAILKNKKVWLLFHCKSSIVVQYIFAHCFTSKLRKIKRKDKEIKNYNKHLLR